MKKAFLSIIATMLFLVCFISPAYVFAFDPYETYGYDSRGNAVPSQTGYTAEKNVSGDDLGIGAFNSPADIFYAENGTFYIADTGNNRIAVIDDEFSNVIGIYESFIMPDGKTTSLSSPTGVFAVPERNMMYIADSGNERALVCTLSGEAVMEIAKPDSPAYGSDKTFIPRKILADKAGNIYVQLGNITTGAAMFSPDGEFIGFYGANRIEPTAEVVMQRLKNLFSSAEKRAQRTRNIPSGITGFDIDGDFIFTCTDSSAQGLDTVKKLNAAGKNIFADKELVFGDIAPFYGTSQNKFTDIDISEEGFINCLDMTTGRVFQYDENCELIFIAGTKSSQLGGFKEPAALESAQGRLYILDSAKNTVTIFRETEFGEIVHRAVILYSGGYYEEALEPWYEVMHRDGNYRKAYVGAASALLNKGEYREAMKYARLGYSPDIYNKAFAGWRKVFIRENFSRIFLMILIPAVLYAFRKRLKKLVSRISPAVHIRKRSVRNSRESSLKASLVIVILLFFGQIAYGRLYGFQFGYPDDKTFSIVPYLVKSFVVFAAWVIGSRAVSTFLDGSGTAGGICISSARALIPYIIQLYVCVGLSHILVQDEAVFIQVIHFAGIIWTAALLFLAVMNIHGYTPGRTLFSILLTISAMLIMLFLLVLFMSLIQQVWVFASSVFTEITYRIREG